MLTSKAVSRTSCLSGFYFRGPISASLKPTTIRRPITSTQKLYKEDKNTAYAANAAAQTSGEHEGSFARTDNTVRVEYPEEHDLPRSQPVQGRGGMHFKRTLASFSLEGRVGVVTGGARGLGLVMSQALVESGADVAIVDLNSALSLSQYHSAFFARNKQVKQIRLMLCTGNRRGR